MQVGIILGISHIFIGMLIVGLSIPLVKGTVEMNRWYGVRVAKAFESESNWYEVNRYGGGQLIFAGILLALLGLLSIFLPLRPGDIGFWLLALSPAIVMILPLVQIMRLCRRLP